MAQKYNLTDIGIVLGKVMDDSMVRVIRSGAVGVLGICNPIAGLVGELGNDILSEYNTFKLSKLLTGLSRGLNIEERLNELYTYISSSSEKAIIVANLFKQTINAECPKVCVIYGMILANHVHKNTDFTFDEMIICKALENATDFDLKNFKEIMENNLNNTQNGTRVPFLKNVVDITAYTNTCDWCVFNRIFISKMAGWEEIGKTLNLDTYYYVASPAEVLLKYINNAMQIWDYE